MNAERLKEIETKKLYSGAGESVDHACVMQMVSYLAGEKWSDSPECACPVLTRYAIYLNDKFNDDHRQQLKEFIPALVGSRMNDTTQIARKRMIMWRYVTVTYPLLLDLWKLPEMSAQIRDIPNSIEGMAKAKEILDTNRQKFYTDVDAYANANAYADANANADANADANAYADADANAYADADANAYANAYADADANAYVDANAYADADANAYADADALREKIVESAVETLRLAIAIRI